MRTIRIKLYKFNELSKEAQQKAVENLQDINVDYEWYQFIDEDAENIGLKITNWDMDSASFIYNVRGEFNLSANEVAANIFRDHGENCDTYKTAEAFMERWQPVFNKYMKTEKGECNLINIESDFLNLLLNDYKKMLQDEFNDRCSEKAIIETIETNEYEFTKDGKLN